MHHLFALHLYILSVLYDHSIEKLDESRPEITARPLKAEEYVLFFNVVVRESMVCFLACNAGIR